MTIGRLVSPTLKLVRLLGEGGMGTVWAAEHLALGSLVAVKMLARGYADEEKSIARFKLEAQRAARVKSPHVATVFDHGMTSENEPYIVMELLEGETLSERIRRHRVLLPDEVENLVGQTAKALKAAHKLGVVHRDIKPANLFIVDNEGEPFVKVLDFGIAKQMDIPPDLTSSSIMVGSPPYMSPEQYMNPKQVDLRTDLWALGVVVYEALTGVRPFAGVTPMATAMAITRGQFRPPSDVYGELPRTLDRWMSKALAVEPEKRFSSASEMVDALKNVLHGRSDTQRKAVDAARPNKTVVRSEPPPHGADHSESFVLAATVPTPKRQTRMVDLAVSARDVPTKPARPKAKKIDPAPFRFFEGCWVAAPLHGHYYCRIIQGKPYVAYCFNGNDHLSGEYYQCVIVGRSLYGRFRWPLVPHLKGFAMMHATSQNTMVGGWWRESMVPAHVAQDLSKLNTSIPGMSEVAWRRANPPPPFPDWVEAHFDEIKARAIVDP